MARHSCVSYFAFIISSIGMLANVLSVGTSSWLVSETSLKMAIGIFRHCNFDSAYCGGMSEIGAVVDAQEVAWFRAVQALFLLACLGSVLVCGLLSLVMINFFDSRTTFKVVTAVSLLTVVAEVMAVCFFGLHYQDIFVLSEGSDDYLGYSFYAAIAAIFFLFIGFVAAGIEASQTSKVLQNMQHRLTVWSTPYTLFIDQEQA